MDDNLIELENLIKIETGIGNLISLKELEDPVFKNYILDIIKKTENVEINTNLALD